MKGYSDDPVYRLDKGCVLLLVEQLTENTTTAAEST